MAAMTSFYAEKCCHLVSVQIATVTVVQKKSHTQVGSWKTEWKSVRSCPYLLSYRALLRQICIRFHRLPTTLQRRARKYSPVLTKPKMPFLNISTKQRQSTWEPRLEWGYSGMCVNIASCII